ncbi:Helicase-like transcription factor chr28 [Thalictrum thalictroides]|uniref:Helicase-like transcription factor chr28 n=1 Tax=Thalictrum thalictroides TaxID=46969 RepID=A0A7J6WIP2_THATH|nr:Helicase-like transcription factor chr28 [Thalictrum thalictroides]
MSDHVNPLHDLYDLTCKCCTFLSGWVSSFIVRHVPVLFVKPDENCRSKYSIKGKNRLTAMAPMDPIDIISSDSENETELVRENELMLPIGSASSSIPRKLPSWDSASTKKQNGYSGLSRSQQLPERASSSVDRPTNYNHLSVDEYQKHPSSIYRGATPNQHMSLVDNPKSSKDKMNGLYIEDLDNSVSSTYKERFGNGYGNASIQHTVKRSLPPSFHLSSSTAKAQAGMGTGGNFKSSDTHNKSYQSLDTNIINHKVHTTNTFGGRNNDEVYMYEHSGSRILPPSLMHGKLLPCSQSAGSSNSAYNSAGTEEGPTDDERLIYQAALQNLSQPKVEASLPDGLLAVPLMRHQKIALAWLSQKETTSVHCLGGILADDQGLGKTVSMIALILLQKHIQSISATDDLQTVKTEAFNLDDDDDGISESVNLNQSGEADEVKPILKTCGVVPTFHKGRPAAGTLVVCPASVLRQWARELNDKVSDSAKLAVLIYHGGTRTKDPVELAKYDVVLTTYSIVANEVPKQPLVDDDDEDQKDGEKYGLSYEFTNNKKRKKASNANKKSKKGRKGLDSSSIDCGGGTLARVGWFRVILDEAQTIKNHRTQVARACCGLRAKRRWCLSGTPIQNTIDDLFSYFRFLKYDPYSVYKSFCSSIKYPISKNSAHGYKKLQAVLKTIMLRRTKGTLLDGEPIINLPPKSICLMKVDFSIEERSFYSKLEADSRSQFKAYAAAGTVNQNYANILLMLLRLRQACDHPLLVKGDISDFVGKASVEMAKRLPRELLLNLLNLLEDPICSLCSDPPEQAVVTLCGHVFCYQCVSDYLTGDDNFCPAHECKEQLGTDIVFAKATLRNCISGNSDDDTTSSSEGRDKTTVLQDMYTSSKIRAALEILEKHCKLKKLCNKYLECSDFDDCAATNSCEAERSVKAIVFSQWTGMLNLVENSLKNTCIQYRRFDGTMSLASRDKAVKDFNNDPEVTVMLMSLKAGNLGLNMVAACHVILLDLWWNPTTEDQAVDRAHRIGQTRPVTVSRLTITNTVEDRILALQEEKRKMVASAFGEDQMGGSSTRLTVEDLRYLFMV